MTREEQIERVAQALCAIRWEQLHTKAPPVARWDRLLESERNEWCYWAERIVAALTQPAEDTSESVQAKVDRMRALTESVSERNQRIERLRGEPVEVTDEMVERAWNAGQDDLPAGQRWDKPALRIALRAALEAGTGPNPRETSR